MAWYRAGGGGIPSAIKTDMNAVLNKKFGTSTTYAPEDWPEDVNLLGPLPEKMASGAIAHVEDGADTVPLKAWDVTVDANLDGVSSIEVTQAGKNLFNKNDSSSIVVGSFSSSGFSTSGTGARTVYVPIKGGATYTVSKTAGKRFSVATSDVPPTNGATFTSKQDNHQGTEITITAGVSDKYLWAWVYLQGEDTSTLADILASIQIEVGSSASTYSAYEAPTVTTVSLGRTIYGGSADIVTGEGKETYNVIRLDSINFIKSSTQNNPNGTYFSCDGVSVPFLGWGSGGRDSAMSNVLTKGSAGAGGQTEQNNTFWWNNASTGWRVVWGSPNGGSSLTDFMTFLTENNVVVGGPLKDAEITDFTFTPITPTPDTALGVNNFWADEGDSEVTYRADISLALSALGGRGLSMMRPVNTEEIEFEEEENR